MSTAELRELADLDALGLLDEVDTHRFEQALQDATVVDQEMVRNRQAMLLQRLVGPPVGTLPGDLEDRVLSAVREEIARQDDDLAPIATIGRRRRDRTPGSGTYTSGAPDLATSVNFDPLAITRLRRASAVWRAASFGLAAGLLVAITLSIATREQAQEVTERSMRQASSLELNEVFHEGAGGRNLSEVLHPLSSDDVFGLASLPGAHVAIACAINTRNTANSPAHVKICVLGADPGARFRLEVQQDDGTWAAVDDFTIMEGEELVTLAGITPRTSLECANRSIRVVDLTGGEPVVVAQRII